MRHIFWRSLFSWKYFLRLLVVIAGLFLYALGIVLTYRSGVGLDPWDVFHQGISRHTPLSFGMANIVVGAALIVLTLALKVYPGVGTILNMLLIGTFVDLLLRFNIIPDMGHLALFWRLLCNALGVGIIGLGTAFYITPRLGTGPRDGLMMRLHTLTGLRVAIVRTSIEVCVLVIGFLLGGTVGIGTLIFALGIGPAVEGSFYLLKKMMAWMGLTSQPRSVPQVHMDTVGESATLSGEK